MQKALTLTHYPEPSFEPRRPRRERHKEHEEKKMDQVSTFNKCEVALWNVPLYVDTCPRILVSCEWKTFVSHIAYPGSHIICIGFCASDFIFPPSLYPDSCTLM